MADPVGSTEASVPPTAQPAPVAGADSQVVVPTGTWERIKEHKVVQWTLAYAAAAYTLLHATEMISEALDWPHLIARILTLVLLLGVPVVITLAWYHGAKGLKRFSAAELTIITILLVIAGGVLWTFSRTSAEHAPQATHPPTTAVAAPPGVSLAVLPFVNMSSDSEQEYFSDGLSEEVMNELAQIRELRVTGRTSSFSFKGKNEDLRTIGKALDVTNILEGSVRKSGKSLRITAQLINSRDGTHLWSHTYEREMTGVFAIQEEIAKEVARALSIKLDVGAMSRARGGTIDLEAYDKYLRARTLEGQLGQRELGQAAQLLREALALDPTFARAWADLYGTLALLEGSSSDNADAVRKERAEALARVVALAPNAWWTHAILAFQFMKQHKWPEAEAAARASSASEAGDEGAYGSFLGDLGRSKEALEYAEREREADPLSLSVSGSLQLALDAAARPNDAQREYERSKQLTGFHGPYDWYALLRIWSRKNVAASAVKAQLSVVASGGGPLSGLHYTLADNLDNKEVARAAIRKAFEDPANQMPVQLFVIAHEADHFGDQDLTLAALQRAYVDLHWESVSVLWVPFETGVRADPRFKDLMRELGLADYFRASGKWGDVCEPVGKDDFECH